MATLLLRLEGPMQSWGTRSRFDERDTDLEPSKSGVLGLVCAALGRDRAEPVSDLAALRMGVRVDQEGVLRRDFQTAQLLGRKKSGPPDTVVSQRHYLSGAVFLVGLEGGRPLLSEIHDALRNPRWVLYLGRKSYVPSRPVWLDEGVVDAPLEAALQHCVRLVEDHGTPCRTVIEVAEGFEGSERMDEPIAPFAERRFGVRRVRMGELSSLGADAVSSMSP